MIFHIVWLYPDLMNLYGSYANVWMLQDALLKCGHTAEVTKLLPEDPMQGEALAKADFIFMGAGTERSQKAALKALVPFREALTQALNAGAVLYFAGTAMELLGQSIRDAEDVELTALGLFPFFSVQGKERLVTDVIGECAFFPEPVIGFTNKASRIYHVEHPFLHCLSLGFGNEEEKGAEGFWEGRAFGSELTGPLLVKNPALLTTVLSFLMNKKGLPMPDWKADETAQNAYRRTLEQLQTRL